MCIDIAKRNIYVFGGRILTPRNIEVLPNEPVSFSGLYSYHIPTNTWTQILVDCAHPTASNPEVISIKSRVTHCMLFHHVCTNIRIWLFLFVCGIFNSKFSFDLYLHESVATSETLYFWRPTKQRICNGFHFIWCGHSKHIGGQYGWNEIGQK